MTDVSSVMPSTEPKQQQQQVTTTEDEYFCLCPPKPVGGFVSELPSQMCNCNPRKRARVDTDGAAEVDTEQPKAKRVPAIKFMLQISVEGEDAMNYAAPIDCDSVKKVKKAIAQCIELEKKREYYNASVDLASCLRNRIDGCEDDEELVTLSSNIDTKELITDADLAQKVWKEVDNLDSLDEQPDVLYQVYLLQGWC